MKFKKSLVGILGATMLAAASIVAPKIPTNDFLNFISVSFVYFKSKSMINTQVLLPE